MSRIVILLLGFVFLHSGLLAQPAADQKPDGLASYYADFYEGRQTASGSIYRHADMTAATLSRYPLGTRVRVTNLNNGRSVVVEINDRISKEAKALIDLSKKAAEVLGFIREGLAPVKVEVLAW